MTTELALEHMGINFKPSGNGWGIAVCPIHDDSSPSMSINFERGTWHCYAGCGQGSMVDLAVEMISQGYSVNLRLVKTAMRGINDPMAHERRMTEVDKIVSSLTGEKRNQVLPENKLDGYLAYSDHIHARGISKEVALRYRICYDMQQGRIVIPIRDHQGRLRGIEARNSKGPKYTPIVRCDKGTWVWGAYLIQRGLPVVVFEGALGASRATTLGIANAVALLGSSHRKTQVLRLVQSSSVIIALDPDTAGRHGAKELYESLYTSVSAKIVELPADIDDIGVELLEVVK